MTSDPNSLAMNKKMSEQEIKTQKQLDALAKRLTETQRENDELQVKKRQQEEKGNLQRQIDDNKAANQQLRQEIRDNKHHKRVVELKHENEKQQLDGEALNKVKNSPEFQKPKDAYVKERYEQERRRAYLQDEKNLIEHHARNREEEAELSALIALNYDRYEVLKPRFSDEFIKLDKRKAKMANPLIESNYDLIYHGMPIFTLVNGKIGDVKGKPVFNKDTGKYVDDNGNQVYTYHYEDNFKTDYEMYQLILQAREKEHRSIQRKIREEKSKVDSR